MRILIFICLLLTSLSALAEWKLISDEDQIKVYEKQNHTTDIIPLRAEAIVNYNIKQIVAILGNTKRKKEWMPALHSARTLSQKSYWDRIEYSRSLIPWPFSDRDFVYHAKVEVSEEGKRYIAYMKSVEGHVPLVDGVVRGFMLDGTMDLREIDSNNTYIKMNFNSDPKGNLPRWLANWAQKQWPSDMIKALRVQLGKLYPKIQGK